MLSLLFGNLISKRRLLASRFVLRPHHLTLLAVHEAVTDFAERPVRPM